MSVRKHVTLVANTTQTVTLTGNDESIEVVNHGADPVYFTIDGTTAIVQGNDTHVAAACGFYAVASPDHDGTVAVSLIAAATQDVSVALIGVA